MNAVLFFLTLSTVGTMLLYAVPGYLLIRCRVLKPENIHVLVKLLLYVNQTALLFHSFLGVAATPEMLKHLALTFLVAMALLLGTFGVSWLLLHRRYESIPCRIYSIAVCLGNVGFFGIPLIEALLPDCPEAVAYAVPFSFALNVFCWSLGAAVITGDRKYAKIQKALFNPASIASLLGLLMVLMQWKLPALLDSAIYTLGRMSTPMCLLILGMRLADAGFWKIFRRWQLYLVALVKQMLVPFALLLCLRFMNAEPSWAMSVFLLSCCPCASMVLNFAELLNAGQDTAADQVLLSTLLSILTIPVMVLLYQTLMPL